MDKTEFIMSELQKMLNNGEIVSHAVNEVKHTISYLRDNNIYKYERANCREKYGDVLIDILGEARKRYWKWKEESEK